MCECFLDRTLLARSVEVKPLKKIRVPVDHFSAMKYDLTGMTFNRLTVLNCAGKTKHGKYLWNCRCSCGKKATVVTSKLRTGYTKSCGCYRIDKMTRHGHKTTTTESGTHRSWKAMKQRCNNHNSGEYHRYGGRGIRVCRRWERFENFLADMGERPEGLSIDRINNDRGYCPSNCKWSTPKEQTNNRRCSPKYRDAA